MLVSTNDPSAGGAQRQALLLAERLQGHGVPVTVLTPRVAPATPRVAPNGASGPTGNVEVVRLPMGRVLRGWVLLAGLLVWAALHRRRARVLHAHSVPLGIIGCAVGWVTGTPVIVKIPSWKSFDYLRGASLGRRLRRWIVNTQAYRIVAVSHELAEALVVEGLAPEKVVVLPNGVDLDGAEQAGSARALKAEVVGDSAARVVLFVGRLVPEKAIDRLLDVWASVSKEPRVLLLVGDGPLRRELEDAVAARGLGDSVRFVGHRHDARRFYGIADVFVLSSSTEGLSNSLLEAMAAGLPVVASDVGGNRDVVTPGSGVLVDWRDVAACAGVLDTLLEDDDVRRDVGRAARERARAFAMETIVTRYRELYGEALAHDREVCGEALTGSRT
jgi:glycosyltransferase involved in cell wall biosynthesis